MGNNETTPETGMVLQVEATDIFFLLIFSDSFSLFLHLARVSATTDSMRLYGPYRGFTGRPNPPVCAIARRFAVSPAQSQEHGGDCRRQAVTLGELDRAVDLNLSTHRS